MLTKYKPLKAYTINILGSLAGIVCFTLVSLLSLPSWVWFLVALLLMIPFLPKDRSFGRNVILLFGVVFVIGASDFAYQNIWSPYYRLNLYEEVGEDIRRVGFSSDYGRGEHYMLTANGAGHLGFESLEQSDRI